MRQKQLVSCLGAITLAGLFLLPSLLSASETMGLAIDLYREGKMQEAKELLAGHLEEHPDDLGVRIGYVRIRRALGEGEAARREAAAYAEANPDDEGARLVQIIALSRSLTRMNMFEEFLKEHPGNARAWEEYGRAFVDTWAPASALVPLKKAIDLDPQRGEPHFLLGLAYRALGEGAEERAALARAREFDPDDPGIALEWAITLLYDGEMKEAIPMLESLLLELPNDPYPPAMLALAYHRMGDEEKKAEAKGMILERSPTFFNKLLYRGLQLRGVSQYVEAKRILTLVIDLEPENGEAYMQLGIAFRMAKDYENAVRVFNAAVEMEEGATNPLIWRNLGKSYQDLGNLPAAEENLRKSLEIDSDYLIAWVDMAQILGLQGKFEESIKTWNRVLSMAPYGWEAAAAREALPFLENGEIPPAKQKKTGKFTFPVDLVKPKDGEKN